jgi:ferric-dicitrate binding protein FerR (iron transport regulator)
MSPILTRLVVFALAIAPALAPTVARADGDPIDPAKAAELRKTCTDAMNADPAFAKGIVAVADENAQHARDEATRKAHDDAEEHIAKNERHVVYAYSALWVIAAAFVIFLWLRQQKLNAEIVHLRADLAAAIKQPPTTVEPVPSK